jgi:hypothetical protein
MAEERPKKDADRKAGFQDRDLPDLIAQQKQLAQQFDPEIDRALLRLALVRALKLPEADRPWLATMLTPAKGEAIDAALIDQPDRLLVRADQAGRREALRIKLLTKGTTKELMKSKDPMIKLALALRPRSSASRSRPRRGPAPGCCLAPMYAKAMREAPSTARWPPTPTRRCA